MKLLSRVWLFATPWTVAYQALPSMGFSRQKYWSGLPFPFPGDLPNPGIEPRSSALQADALPSEPLGKPLTTRTTIQSSNPISEYISKGDEITILKTSALLLLSIIQCYSQPHPSTENWIEDLLSMAPPIRTKEFPPQSVSPIRKLP